MKEEMLNKSTEDRKLVRAWLKKWPENNRKMQNSSLRKQKLNVPTLNGRYLAGNSIFNTEFGIPTYYNPPRINKAMQLRVRKIQC